MTLSAALPCIINLLATEKHLTSDGLVFFFFFYLTETLWESQTDILVRLTSCGGPTAEYRNSDYTHLTTVGYEGTATVLRVQKTNC